MLVLHSLGSVVVVRWERFEGEEVVVEELVVLDPKWLIGVLKVCVCWECVVFSSNKNKNKTNLGNCYRKIWPC